jgi:hypothetical protein
VNSVVTFHPQTTSESTSETTITLFDEEPSPVLVERDPKRSPAVWRVYPLRLYV